MVDWTTCPECGRPAEIERRFVLPSTAGPLEHVRIRCVQRHWFAMPVAALPSVPAPPPAAAAPVAARRADAPHPAPPG